MRGEQGSGRGERERGVGRDGARERRALGQPDERVVVGVVELDVADERLRRDVLEHVVELAHRGDERLELVRRLEALCREPGGRALEHAAQLDPVA